MDEQKIDKALEAALAEIDAIAEDFALTDEEIAVYFGRIQAEVVTLALNED